MLLPEAVGISREDSVVFDEKAKQVLGRKVHEFPSL
jgi:hypothetical protein